jgi:hypothetical protein
MGKSKNKSRTPRPSNAWILFCNGHDEKIRNESNKKVKRRETMKSAKKEWDSMTPREKFRYFLESERKKRNQEIEEANQYLIDENKLNLMNMQDGFINMTSDYFTSLEKYKENKKIEDKFFDAYINSEACEK